MIKGKYEKRRMIGLLFNDVYIRVALEEELEKERIQSFNHKFFYIFGRLNHYHLNRWGLLLKNIVDSEEFELGIEIEVHDKELTIFNHVILITKESSLISLKNTNNDKLLYRALSLLYGYLDTDTREGRQLLLETLLYKYLGETTNVPDHLKTKTKKLNLRFARKVDDFEHKKVPVHQIAGTTHPDYRGHSWYDIFFRLKRRETLLNTICFSNSKDTLRSNNFESDKISFVQIDEEYFTDQGSHRTTVSKFIDLDYIVAPVAVYKTDLEYMMCFEKIGSMGFQIRTASRDEARFARGDIEYEWEYFIVNLSDNSEIHLLSIKEIRFFIEFIQNINMLQIYKLRFKNAMHFFKGDAIYKNQIEKAISKNSTQIMIVMKGERKK